MSVSGARVPWIIDASPLWELNYTGVSNVVYEIVRRAIVDSDWEVHVLAAGRVLHRDLVLRCVEDRSGRALQEAKPNLPQANKILDILRAQGQVDGTVGLYLNTRPHYKQFDWEAMMFYDFSPLLTPECHTPETVTYHTEGISQQVSVCDHMFCISEATARDLCWIFDVERDRITVCLLGHSADAGARRAAKAITSKVQVEPFLLMLGTIEPRKNIGLVLEWLSTYSDILDTHRVVFAGRQGWGPDLQTLIQRWGLEAAARAGRIIYMDYISEERKNALLSGASALLYPSLFEGFGLPVLEAMGFELPVLATVSTSLPEVLGDTGYYFDPYSSTSLDAAFRLYLEDARNGRLEQMVEAAHERANTFSYDTTYALVRNRMAQAAREVVHSGRATT